MVKGSKPRRIAHLGEEGTEEEEEEKPVVDHVQPTKIDEVDQEEHQDAEQRPSKRRKAAQVAQHKQQSAKGDAAELHAASSMQADDVADKQEQEPGATAPGSTAGTKAAAGGAHAQGGAAVVQGQAKAVATTAARAPKQAQHESGKLLKTSDSLQPTSSGSLSVRKRIPKKPHLVAAEARKVWLDVDDDDWGNGVNEGRDEPPAVSVCTTPPHGDDATGWGLWQYYEDEDENGVGDWFRGVVFGYDASKRQYLFCMEDGEREMDYTEAQWIKDFRNKELILCKPPAHMQLAAEQEQAQVDVDMEQQPSGEGATKQQARKRKRPPAAAAAAKQQQTDAVQQTAAAADQQGQAAAAADGADDDADISAAAALAMVMPGAVHDHTVQPDDKDEAQQQQQQQSKAVSETKRKQQQQRRQQAQQLALSGSGKGQQRQQAASVSPHGPRLSSGTMAAAAAASAAATAALQRPLSGGNRGPTQRQLDLSGLPDKAKILAERLQQLQVAERQLQRFQQEAMEALAGIGELVAEDEAGFADIAKDMRQHLDAQQQQQEGSQQQQQARKTSGPGTRLCMLLKTLANPENNLILQQRNIQEDAEEYFTAMRPGGGGTAARQKSGPTGQQQQHPQRKPGTTGSADKQQQPGQQSRLPGGVTSGVGKQDAVPHEKQKQERVLATAAGAAKVDELQAALKQQQAATEAAEKVAADRSKELQMLRNLVPVQLLDNPLRDKAVAMLAALLQPPVAMSPFAMAHQIEAELHDQHGLVGTGKHMYLQHLHFIWNVLGGKQLEAAAEAADEAHQKAYAAAGVEISMNADSAVERRHRARQAAAAAKAAADAAVAAAKAAMVVQPGIADPSSVRAALLGGKLSVVDLVHETAVTLGFDQQRDK